ADDVMLPERLGTQLAYHQAHAEVDASSCHCHYIDEQGRYMGVQRYGGLRTAAEGRQALARGETVLVAFTGLMLSRRVYGRSGGLHNRFWPCDDFEFCNRLLEQGYSLVILEQVLMCYRIHTSAVTTSKPMHVFDVLDYASHCIKQRRVGPAEEEQVSFDAFMAMRQRDAWWVKADRRRYRYAVILHRQAGFSLRTKNYSRFVGELTASMFLSPTYGIASIHKQLTRLSSQ
ncbi:hypothetical protein CDA63_05685, partial [Hymenobacter amundsenii]